MKKQIAILAVLMLAVAPMQGFAASPWTEAPTYGEKTTQKLAFGLKNVLLGWLEIINEPYKASEEGKNWLSGVGTGLADFVINTVGGALHTGTFFIPVDIPLPDNGVDI